MDSSDDEQVTLLKTKKKVTVLDSDASDDETNETPKKLVLKDSSDSDHSDGESKKNSKDSDSEQETKIDTPKSQRKRAAFAESDSDSDAENEKPDLNKSRLKTKGLDDGGNSSDEDIDKVASSRGSSRSNSRGSSRSNSDSEQVCAFITTVGEQFLKTIFLHFG